MARKKKDESESSESDNSESDSEKDSDNSDSSEDEDDKTPATNFTSIEDESLPPLRYHFTEELDDKYICCACKKCMKEPQKMACKHLGCMACISTLKTCPACKKVIDYKKLKSATVEANEIDGLEVKCRFYKSGCNWEGTVSEHEDHLRADCGYGVFKCPLKCGEQLNSNRLEEHINKWCQKRVKKCDYCNKDIRADGETQHWNVCTRFPMDCPNNCGKNAIPRNMMDEHLDTECINRGHPCPFHACGCDVKAERAQLKKHVKEAGAKHLTMVGETTGIMMKLLHDHQCRLEELGFRIDREGKRIENLEKLYGAQLLWKIDRYADKMQDAKSGRKATIFSPPFMTSRHGYKLALSACLNGDGKGRGRYMSLFICICKGDYDAILPWPFTHKLCFTLIDQRSDVKKRRNITYLVKPNPIPQNMPFLGRPQGERNASFGAQKFVELSVVRKLGYVKDDCMFVSVNMDLDSVPMERPAATTTAASTEMVGRDEILTN